MRFSTMYFSTASESAVLRWWRYGSISSQYFIVLNFLNNYFYTLFLFSKVNWKYNNELQVRFRSFHWQTNNTVRSCEARVSLFQICLVDSIIVSWNGRSWPSRTLFSKGLSAYWHYNKLQVDLSFVFPSIFWRICNVM